MAAIEYGYVYVWEYQWLLDSADAVPQPILLKLPTGISTLITPLFDLLNQLGAQGWRISAVDRRDAELVYGPAELVAYKQLKQDSSPRMQDGMSQAYDRSIALYREL
jgi:hypothetical protein